MISKIYLVRHSESALNSDGVYYGRTDCELTKKGLEQNQSLKDNFFDIEFDAIFTSPLKRAYNTANEIAKSKKCSIILDSRIIEMDFGDWEGRHYSDIMQNEPKNWELWCNDWKNAKPYNGESFLDLYNRVYDFLSEIRKIYSNKTILIVSHQGCLRVIASILLGLNENGYWSFSFEHGKYSLFEIDNDCSIVRYINVSKGCVV